MSFVSTHDIILFMPYFDMYYFWLLIYNKDLYFTLLYSTRQIMNDFYNYLQNN